MQLRRISALADARGLRINYDRRNGVRLFEGWQGPAKGGHPGRSWSFKGANDLDLAEAFLSNYTREAP